MIYFKVSTQDQVDTMTKKEVEADPSKIELIGLNDSSQDEIEILNESLQLAHTYFYAVDLNIMCDKTVTIVLNDLSRGTKTLEEWYLGNISLHNDQLLIDAISENVGSSVAVYQKTDMGFICISSTTNTKEKGVGSVLPFSSSVGTAINEGVTCTSIVEEGDELILTAYEPIIHKGSLIGILSVSISTTKDSKKEGRWS
ncbi:MAG: Cache 3/Cache 2 fusion domain-containing protein [Bacteroidales bacterium]|nr:Cache 3/Cache 2 fusion domain-containing protein [Bacteroidales bacterium]